MLWVWPARWHRPGKCHASLVCRRVPCGPLICVIRGARIEHVCGDPHLGPEKDYAYGMRIVTTALEAIARPVSGPTLFDPLAPAPAVPATA